MQENLSRIFKVNDNDRNRQLHAKMVVQVGARLRRIGNVIQLWINRLFTVGGWYNKEEKNARNYRRNG